MPDQPSGRDTPSSASPPTSRPGPLKPDTSQPAAAQSPETGCATSGLAHRRDPCSVVPAILQTFGGADKVVELGTDTTCPQQDVLSGSDAAFSVLQCTDAHTMAEDLKIAVVGATRTLQRLRPADRGWSILAERLYQNPTIHSEAKDDICRACTFESHVPVKGRAATQKDEADPVVKEFQTWFTQLIADPDTQAGRRRISLEVASQIVAHACKLVDRGIPSEKENRETKLLDLAVLRYPLPEDLTIKLYHIELWAWSESKFPLDPKSKTCRLSGQFNLRSFGPRKDIVSRLPDRIKDWVFSEAITMFAG